ncbi:hypothetical protein BST27_11435 [Mycobacterium intermedium]|uniref:DUF2563 domain-containing protein n=1 Tax=Mycobacterium intermedium TaxID=28445 RepID=A0A1E3SBJ0_MYCIE|nr:DUF2563 family protein [Mycobacterium intermedium]MCV6963183.1 DUF2563 family protein [Mycobacterium intermedium]ODQ99535.1 hypothetical protein BHQ20_16915 [Mycobacterium intermedium]OPE51699.1 hypothetical protein BV508_05440 [Mycobacterium intermedium]ORB06105.1 hypothetical protein BST27_11435 [Mycobacterium intermedium]
MFVDIEVLHLGANDARHAGEHAMDGAGRLLRGPLQAGMFGGFVAAEMFHDVLNSAYAAHVGLLQTHGETLTSLGGRAYRAAVEFTDMEQRNAAVLRAVPCISST